MAAILCRQRFVHAVLHHRSEHMEGAAILREGVVVVDSANLRIIPVQDVQIRFVQKVAPSLRLPDVLPVVAADGDCVVFQQLVTDFAVRNGEHHRSGIMPLQDALFVPVGNREAILTHTELTLTDVQIGLW